MSTITIGFSRPKETKLISSLIMTVERTKYSHVYIRWHSTGIDRTLIYQASGLAVNFMGLDHFLDHNTIVDEFDIEVSEESRRQIIQFAVDTVGLGYGTKQILGIGILRIGSAFGARWKNPFRDGRQTYVCSELVAHIMKSFMSEDIDINLDDISPKDIYEILLGRSKLA